MTCISQNYGNEYATIKFDDGEYSTTNIQAAAYTILPKETKEVTITVKSQNGEEIKVNDGNTYINLFDKSKSVSIK